MYLKSRDFIESRPLFVIDTTKQPENVPNSKNNIIINIDFQNALNLPSDSNIGTTAYVVVVSENILHYDIIRNDILEVNFLLNRFYGYIFVCF